MSDIEKVLASEEIGKLEAVHFRCVDSRDWDGYEAASAPDAVFGISRARPGCDLIGPDKIAEEAGGPLTRRVSVHCGLCQEIEGMKRPRGRGAGAGRRHCRSRCVIALAS